MIDTVGFSPCPFCGAEDISPSARHPEGFYTSMCYVCGAEGPAAEDSEGASREWNRRTPVDTLQTEAYAEGRADQAEEQGWQPIETASKNGGRMLAYDEHRRRVAVVRYTGEGWDDDDQRRADPTHWIPLPHPPREQS